MYVQVSPGSDSLVIKRYGAGRARANGIEKVAVKLGRGCFDKQHHGAVFILVEHRRRAKHALSRRDAQCLVYMDSHLYSVQSRFTAPKLPSTDTEPISRVGSLSACETARLDDSARSIYRLYTTGQPVV